MEDDPGGTERAPAPTTTEPAEWRLPWARTYEERYPEPPAPETAFEKKYPMDRYGEETSDTARVWTIYRERAIANDEDLIEAWNGNLDTLLIFAGLFSAAVTAFIIEVYQLLEPDYVEITAKTLLFAHTNQSVVVPILQDFVPPSYARWTNGLWFLSLTIALLVALLAILAKQWLSEYKSRVRAPVASPRRWAQRHIAYHGGLIKWKMDAFLSALPVLLHLSLFLFLAGIVVFISELDWTIARLVLSLTAAVLALYGAATFLPLFSGDAPTATPLLHQIEYQSRLVLHGVRLVLRGVVFIGSFSWWRPAPGKTADQDDTSMKGVGKVVYYAVASIPYAIYIPLALCALAIASPWLLGKGVVWCVPRVVKLLRRAFAWAGRFINAPLSLHSSYHESRLVDGKEALRDSDALHWMVSNVADQDEVDVALDAIGSVDASSPKFLDARRRLPVYRSALVQSSAIQKYRRIYSAHTKPHPIHTARILRTMVFLDLLVQDSPSARDADLQMLLATTDRQVYDIWLLCRLPVTGIRPRHFELSGVEDWLYQLHADASISILPSTLRLFACHLRGLPATGTLSEENLDTPAWQRRRSDLAVVCAAALQNVTVSTDTAMMSRSFSAFDCAVRCLEGTDAATIHTPDRRLRAVVALSDQLKLDASDAQSAAAYAYLLSALRDIQPEDAYLPDISLANIVHRILDMEARHHLWPDATWLGAGFLLCHNGTAGLASETMDMPTALRLVFHRFSLMTDETSVQAARTILGDMFTILGPAWTCEAVAGRLTQSRWTLTEGTQTDPLLRLWTAHTQDVPSAWLSAQQVLGQYEAFGPTAQMLVVRLCQLHRAGETDMQALETILGQGRGVQILAASPYYQRVAIARHAMEISPSWWQETSEALVNLEAGVWVDDPYFGYTPEEFVDNVNYAGHCRECPRHVQLPRPILLEVNASWFANVRRTLRPGTRVPHSPV